MLPKYIDIYVLFQYYYIFNTYIFEKVSASVLGQTALQSIKYKSNKWNEYNYIDRKLNKVIVSSLIKRPNRCEGVYRVSLKTN
jgi:hypothetical protein